MNQILMIKQPMTTYGLMTEVLLLAIVVQQEEAQVYGQDLELLRQQQRLQFVVETLLMLLGQQQIMLPIQIQR